ncbi:hypothetical protein [Stieleria varia]|uniref:Secreted protein n=1 Tax=Stieleria varia TaxID=2528005 RepID=A0A5C6AF27_9BACT|nr:hypothetical protein [Stieleria varia]TWT98219.1 hypothetical protein Pla52n_47290 [Stieleria varia]
MQANIERRKWWHFVRPAAAVVIGVVFLLFGSSHASAQATQQAIRLTNLDTIDADDIHWSPRDRDGLAAGIRFLSRPMPGDPTMIIQHLVRNESEERQQVHLSIHGRDPSLLTLSAGNRIDVHFSGSWEDDLELAPGEVIGRGHWRSMISLKGLSPGDYTVHLGASVFVRDEERIGTSHGLPMSLKLPAPVFGKIEPDRLEQAQAMDNAKGSLPIRWGTPVGGLRIGTMAAGDESNVETVFHHGELARLGLFVQNVSGSRVKCQLMLSHPCDGWGMNIVDSDGSTIMPHQGFMTGFSPQRSFSATLEPLEIQPITGKLPKFREGNEDKGFTPELTPVEFWVAEQKSAETEFRPPYTYGMPPGHYLVSCYVRLRRDDIPGFDLSLQTGSIDFQVIAAKTPQ